MTLGQRIAQARRELSARTQTDVTLAAIAKAVGVSTTSVSEWEADKKAPREKTLLRLAKYLGVTPAYLRYGVEVAAKPPETQIISVKPAETSRGAVTKKKASGGGGSA